MKCKDCELAVKDFFKCAPNKYVCIGVKEPFVIDNTNVECTEYPEKREKTMERIVYVSSIQEPEFAKPYVDDKGIYIPSRYDPRFHELLISKDLFVEAYNKWIKTIYNTFTPSHHSDDADDWCD